MKKISSILAFIAALSIYTFAAPSLSADTILKSVTPEQMKGFLNDEGFTGAEIDEDNDIIIRMSGRAVLLRFLAENTVVLFIAPTAQGNLPKPITLDSINEWNRTKTFSKAYFDKDGDPVLEFTTDVTGGVTADRVRDSIRTFNKDLVNFESFIRRE